MIVLSAVAVMGITLAHHGGETRGGRTCWFRPVRLRVSLFDDCRMSRYSGPAPG